jgi:hypothetical protein
MRLKLAVKVFSAKPLSFLWGSLERGFPFNYCKPVTSGISSVLPCNLNKQIRTMMHGLPVKLAFL